VIQPVEHKNTANRFLTPRRDLHILKGMMT
jgi:hypothetical protein